MVQVHVERTIAASPERVFDCELIGLKSGFSAHADLREDNHDIVVGEETVGRYLKVLLGHLPEQFLDRVFAATRSADRAVTGYGLVVDVMNGASFQW